jgi:energy-converting hydrogenase Eha subunit A
MLLRELREVGELYIAVRILTFAAVGFVLLACAILPQWLLNWGITALVVSVVAMIPLALLWAVAVVFGALLRSR